MWDTILRILLVFMHLIFNVARALGLNPCSVRSSILSKCIQASSVPGPATCKKPLSFIEVLQNGRMVVLPVRVVWSFRHRTGDLAPHWALSILLPDENRRSEENSDSSFWGMVTCMAVGGGRSAGWGAREDAAGPAAGSLTHRPPLPAGLMAAALPVLGFAGTGIAANSVAASLMSWSAVANGGGVPAGGLVATLQSLGECGQGSWRREHPGQGPPLLS